MFCSPCTTLNTGANGGGIFVEEHMAPSPFWPQFCGAPPWPAIGTISFSYGIRMTSQTHCWSLNLTKWVPPKQERPQREGTACATVHIPLKKQAPSTFGSQSTPQHFPWAGKNFICDVGGVVGKRGSRECAVLRRGTLVVGLPLTLPASYPVLPLASLLGMQPPPLSLPIRPRLENEDAVNHFHL